MPNPHCECLAAGFCPRHQMDKGPREFALCKGVADTGDCGLKYWQAWERGRLKATAPPNPILNPTGFCEGEKLKVSGSKGCCGKPKVQQIWSYTKALAAWTLAGQPERTDEETKDIFDNLCTPCSQFQPTDSGGTCKACGCNLSPTAPASANKIRMATQACPIGKWGLTPKLSKPKASISKPSPRRTIESDVWQYFTTNDLLVEARELASRLPPDIDAVAGIARSGIIPAAIIATQLHLPLYALDIRSGLTPLGYGTRLGKTPAPGKMLVIDDSIWSGKQMEKARKLLAGRNLLTAAIYHLPGAEQHCDLVNKSASSPHLFEWNLFNSVYDNLGYDIDGIIASETNGGPLWLPRKQECCLIATGRHEHFRKATEHWLTTHGVRWKHLAMLPSHVPATSDNIAIHKAEAFAATPYCWLFIESEPEQARTIHYASKKRVLCPAIGKIFQQSVLDLP